MEFELTALFYDMQLTTPLLGMFFAVFSRIWLR